MDALMQQQALASTARWTAAARALESSRDDHLIDDPWAAALAGQEGAEWLEHRPPESTLPMVIRTRFFDDFLQRIAYGEAIRQIAILAAGLDTRAYRLGWPEHTRLFELDQPGVLRYKQQVLDSAGARPLCERHTIGADLTHPWADGLVEAGFDPRQPSGWLLEGFLFYLPGDSLVRLLEEVTALAAPGSWLGFDIINRRVLSSPYTRSWLEMQAAAGAPWIGALDDPVGHLNGLGWQASLTQPGAPDTSYGRGSQPVIPLTAPDMPHNWYVTARKEP